MGLWAKWVLPHLVDFACRGDAINEERARLVPQASGRVLEIGVGSGLNLRYYDPTRVEAVVAIDPSPELLQRAEERRGGARVPVELQVASGERLPFDDESFDSAVVTYTLCSVSDPVVVLREIRRVLRAGAPLHFLEHGIADDAATRRWQRRITPAWSLAGGGCRLDRDVRAELAESGLAIEELVAEQREGLKWLSFTYEGRARR